MLLIIQAIIMAIVEGLTEFIPVSSTGHLILAGKLIGFTGGFANLFSVVIQLGAILAIVVLYWNKLWNSVKNIFAPDRRGLKFWTNIIVAAIPGVILGFLFDDMIEAKLFYTFPVSIALVVGGILMIVMENKYRRGKKINDVDKITVRQAFIVGVFQCLALWPGMSRSASTIIGGWIAGLSTVAAAEFSFFLAIPMMVGASGLSLIKGGMAMSSIEVVALTIGFVASFIVALVVVEKFLKFLQKKPMRIFAVYRIFIGIILLVLSAIGIM